MNALGKVANNFFFRLRGSDFSYCFSDIMLPSLPTYLIKQLQMLIPGVPQMLIPGVPKPQKSIFFSPNLENLPK